MTIIPSISVGHGRIASQRHGPDVVFSELSSTYPLKLVSPRIAQEGVAIVYNLSYGGGLVGGDCVQLSIDVGSRTTLLLLSQGSTKVFKTRAGGRAAGRPRGAPPPPPSPENAITTSTIDVLVAPNSAFFLLPEPVTCFRAASYNQTQTFRLAGPSASVVLLDWVTSGRRSLGEEWVFSRYHSVNEVWVDEKRVARDVLLLEEDPAETDAAGQVPRRTLADRLAPYSCYATLLLHGPVVQDVVSDINAEYRTISVFKTGAPAGLIWSASPIADGRGCVVRVAGKDTQTVKSWLGHALRTLEDVVGIDVYRRAFAQ